MFGLGGGTGDPATLLIAGQLYTREALTIMAACALLVAWPTQAYEWSSTIDWPKALVIHPLFVASLLAMFAQSFNPFLYFQF